MLILSTTFTDVKFKTLTCNNTQTESEMHIWIQRPQNDWFLLQFTPIVEFGKFGKPQLSP